MTQPTQPDIARQCDDEGNESKCLRCDGTGYLDEPYFEDDAI